MLSTTSNLEMILFLMFASCGYWVPYVFSLLVSGENDEDDISEDELDIDELPTSESFIEGMHDAGRTLNNMYISNETIGVPIDNPVHPKI